MAGAALVMVGPVPTAGAAATGGIAGMATDLDGAPLSGVTVWLHGPDTVVSVPTGSDGRFAAAGLPADDYEVCFDPAAAVGGSSSTGYEGRCWEDVPVTDGWFTWVGTPVSVTAGATTRDVVQALPAAGGVSGTVTDEAGEPLAGATVSVASEGGGVGAAGSTRTDEQGRYTVGSLRPGTDYTVCVSAAGVSGGESTTGYLDECLGGVPAQTGPEPEPFGDAATVEVSPGVVTRVDPIGLGAAGRLTGRLTDRDGTPLRGVRVYGWGEGDLSVTAVAVTGRHGRFTLGVDQPGGSANGVYHGARLPLDPFRVFFQPAPADGFVPAYHGGVYSPAGQAWGQVARVVPRPGTPTVLDDTLVRAASVSGVVADDAGNGLPDVEVSLTSGENPAGRATTDDHGRYHLGGLPPGDYVLCADPRRTAAGTSEGGYLPRCSGGSVPGTTPVTLALAPGQQVHRRVVLASAAALAGLVVDGDGRPVWGSVTIRQDGVTVQQVQPGVRGEWHSGPLAPGSYTVCFDASQPSALVPECWADAAVGSQTTPVRAVAGRVTPGIDAVLTTDGPQPDVQAPGTTMSAPARPVARGRVLTASYAGSDAETTVVSYDVRYREAAWDDTELSAPVLPEDWQARSSTEVELAGRPGHTYCFSARARDAAGNVDDWTGERCSTVPLDDRALARSPGWERERRPDAYRRTTSRTRARGASLVLTGAHGAGLGLVVRTCRSCGDVAVVVDGAVVARVSTHARRARSRVVRTVPGLVMAGSTVELRAAERGRTVVVDGLAVLR